MININEETKSKIKHLITSDDVDADDLKKGLSLLLGLYDKEAASEEIIYSLVRDAVMKNPSVIGDQIDFYTKLENHKLSLNEMKALLKKMIDDENYL